MFSVNINFLLKNFINPLESLVSPIAIGIILQFFSFKPSGKGISCNVLFCDACILIFLTVTSLSSLDNLIDLNGNNSLKIQINSIIVNKKITQIYFKEPFPHECLAVIPVDLASTNGFKLAVDNKTVKGFQLWTESPSASWVQYIAIGY